MTECLFLCETKMFFRFEVMFDSAHEPQYATKGLTEAQLDELPLTLYSKSSDGAGRYSECCVCLSPLKTGDSVFISQCGHVYHSVSTKGVRCIRSNKTHACCDQDCIFPWLRITATCPMDRNYVLATPSSTQCLQLCVNVVESESNPT